MSSGRVMIQKLTRTYQVFVGIEWLLRDIVRQGAAEAGLEVGELVPARSDQPVPDPVDVARPNYAYDELDRSLFSTVVEVFASSPKLKEFRSRLVGNHSVEALRRKLWSLLDLRNSVAHCWELPPEATSMAEHVLNILGALAWNVRLPLSDKVCDALDHIVPRWRAESIDLSEPRLSRQNEVLALREAVYRKKSQGEDAATETTRLATAQSALMAEPVPVVKGFHVTERIGSGASASVWLAVDLTTGQQVALRVLQQKYFGDQAAIERFRRGTRCLLVLAERGASALRILRPVKEYGAAEGGSLAYSTKHYPLGDLEAAVLSRTMGPEAGLSVLRDVGEALAELHELGFFHRDVCPQNILLDEETRGPNAGARRGVLSDFDTVIQADELRLSLHHKPLGHLNFIAPERLAPRTAPEDAVFSKEDEREAIAGDVYSLAATALFVVTGQQPGILNDNSTLFDQVPFGLAQVLRRGCAADWRERFGSVRDLVAALHLEPPREVFSRTLSRMRALQGAACDKTLPREAQQQIEGAAIVFAHADAPGVMALWECPVGEVDPPTPDSPPVEAVVRRFLRVIAAFRASCEAGSGRELPVDDGMSEIVDALGHLNLASSDGDLSRLRPDELLFVEYLFGLGYLEVFSHFGALFIEWLEEERARGAAHQGDCPECTVTTAPGTGRSYVDGLRRAFVVHDLSMEYLRTWYRAKNRGKVWTQILDRWNELHRHPELVRGIHRVVSLRRVPEDCPQIITMAQVMHWEGWGGQGKLFREIRRHSRSALARLLAEFESHSFDWHGLSTSELHVNFSHRKNFFASAIVLTADYSAGVAGVLLSHPVLTGNRCASERHVRIWGDAVGPKRVSELRIMENVALCGPHMGVSSAVHFELTLCDAAAPSLHILSKHPVLTARKVREERSYLWRDLNLPFPGEPSWGSSQGAFGNNNTIEAPPPSSFDCYSCAISLHQVADRHHRSRHARIREILAFATRVVRPGGVIAIPDVGHGVALQVFVLPSNLVDREGGWGGDLFSLKEARAGERIHRFQDVASTLDGRFVCHMSPAEQEAAADERVKIPLPLLQLHRGSPTPLAAAGLAIYETIPYLVVDVVLKDVWQLDEDWCAAVETGDGARLVNRVLGAWKPEVLRVVREAPAIVEQLGYELAVPTQGPPMRPAPYLV